jgi:DNA polymerase alpha subunit B
VTKYCECYFEVLASDTDPFLCHSYPQAPLTDRLPNGGKAVNLPNADGLEFGTLGLHHINAVGHEAGAFQDETFTRVHRMPNPCTLKLNELIVGVTSTDIMFHLSTDETNGNLEPGSRLTRIAQHLLQQQSYYPLFPPPANESMAANLDMKHMEQWRMPCQPDLLIVPSKLTCFARPVLDSTVVVNPGHLTRGTTGGSYAVMDIYPIKRETLESAGGDDVEMEHNLQDRIRVEIKRI